MTDIVSITAWSLQNNVKKISKDSQYIEVNLNYFCSQSDAYVVSQNLLKFISFSELRGMHSGSCLRHNFSGVNEFSGNIGT